MELKDTIRSIEGFPKEGIIFRDITTLLRDKEAMKFGIDCMMHEIEGLDFDFIVGPESRGFIFGMPLAYNLGCGFIPVRKQGKLPAKVISQEYCLEYGTAVIEMHEDALKPGQKVVVVDDLLATGGTARAIATLVEKAGAEVVLFSFLMELEALCGRDFLKQYNVSAILKY